MGCVQSGSYLAELSDDPVGARKVSKNSRGAVKGRTRTVQRRERGSKWALEPRFEERAITALHEAANPPQPPPLAADSQIMAPAAEIDTAMNTSPDAKGRASPHHEVQPERPVTPNPQQESVRGYERTSGRIASALTPAPPPQGKVKGKEPMLNPSKLGTVRSWVDATDEDDLVDPNDPVGHDAMMKLRRAHRTTEDEGVFDDF